MTIRNLMTHASYAAIQGMFIGAFGGMFITVIKGQYELSTVCGVASLGLCMFREKDKSDG